MYIMGICNNSQNGIFEIHGTASCDAVPLIVDADPPDAVP
jgi:hypothetical protein